MWDTRPDAFGSMLAAHPSAHMSEVDARGVFAGKVFMYNEHVTVARRPRA